MARFFVRQDADYAMGHLRYGHREGYIEADSIEDAERKLKEEGYTDYLDFVLDDYEVEDIDNIRLWDWRSKCRINKC